MALPYPEATVFHSHARKLSSTVVGQDYRISVGLPPSYDGSNTAYPVVYVLDENTSFGLASNAAVALMFGQEMPEVLIVGIGYDITSYEDWGRYRDRDYTPTPTNDMPGAGGATAFLSFIETELVPFIDSNYRTIPGSRAIYGYSLGGLFVLFALLSKPELFTRYAAGSPSLRWDEQVLFRIEQDAAMLRTSLPATLCLSIGALETDRRADMEMFVTTLRSRRYEGLKLTLLVLEGETHFSALAPAFVHAMKTIFTHSE